MGIEARADEIAMVESMDTGQPIRFMQKAAIRGAANFRFFGDKALEAGKGLSLPAEHHHNFTTRHPLGAVGVITPWNTPFMLSTWKIAPALASGCTVVQKPRGVLAIYGNAAGGDSRSRRVCQRVCSTSSTVWAKRRARR